MLFKFHGFSGDSRNPDEAPHGRLDRWAPRLVALLLFAAYSAWSLNRHARIRTGGYDLGIFEQAIRGYANFGAPIATLKAPGYNLLGDHFHPIISTIAPLYALFPTPATILVFQAALIAVSAIPITRLAILSFGATGGAGIGISYGLSWGLQSAANFDFHEVIFAVPMIAFSLVAIVEKRWRSAALWALPIVLVKEDLPVTLAAIGLVIFLRGQRRIGAAVVGFAAISGIAILSVLIPLFSPTGVYNYSTSQVPSDQGLLRRIFAPWTKWETLVWLLLPTWFLSLLSSTMIVAVPTLAWRFWSTNPLYWGTNFQYSAILMPIVFIAFIEAISNLDFFRHDVRRRWAISAATIACAVTCMFAVPWPMSGLFDGKNWHHSQTVRETRDILARIPDGSSVAADNHLAAQLTARCDVYLFPGYPGYGIEPEWVVYSTPFDTSMAAEVSIIDELERIKSRYTLVIRNDGAVLMRLKNSKTS